MRRRTFLMLSASAPAALGLAACGGPSYNLAGGSGAGVLGVAQANGLDRFVQAAGQAGLADTLAGPGPFTLFVPTDAAFAALPRGQLAALTADPAALKKLVSYHVVPGTFTSEFLDGRNVNYTTLTNKPLDVDGTNGLSVNGARVIRADLAASNGVVHIIDRLLTPH